MFPVISRRVLPKTDIGRYTMEIQVSILEIGTYVHIPSESTEKAYVVLRTDTYQDERGKFLTIVTILPVSDEGDDLGKESRTVYSDILQEM